MTILVSTTPLFALVASLTLGLVLLFRKDKSLLQKALILSIPGLALLQVGTYILLSRWSGGFSLAGGYLVLLSLSYLTPVSSAIALLWGKSNGADRDVLKRFRPLFILQAIASVVFITLIPSGKIILVGSAEYAEPVLAFGAYGRYFLIYLIVSSVVILSVLERKLRYFRKIVELRVPTLIFMGIFTVFIIAASQGLLIRTLNVKLLLLVSFCILLGFLAPAVLRMKGTVYLDRILENRETVYSSFTVLVVGAYLVLIGLSGKLVVAFGGDIQVFFSAVAAVAVIIILFMVVTSLSIRERSRKFVDRMLYKGKNDYRELWRQFSEQTSFSLDLNELTGAILDTTTDILNAASGAILLVDSNTSVLEIVKKKGSGASVDVAFDKEHEFVDWLWRRGESVRLFDEAELSRYPVSFEAVRERFEQLKACLCVPLQTKAGLVGLMVLGEKKAGRYVEEDLRILETLANHSALAIHSLTLQEDLRASKELESFYKLSSFVLHDLRNIASIIAMLAENARHNMDDPEFRENLTNTLAGSSSQIRKMLSKVSLASSSKRDIMIDCIDVAAQIQAVANEIVCDGQYQFDIQVQDGLTLYSDSTLLHKVLLNLMLNALDAMPEGGRLSIRAQPVTSAQPGDLHHVDGGTGPLVRISVSDTGCGISPDFIKKQLFRPFQTTKNKGLGLGLYHCKEIIESLGGRISVESQVNQGSTFHIDLAQSSPEADKNGEQSAGASVEAALNQR
ncbi:MAG: PEP-CTERM system histidine kinase PrsK [Calditrichaeota bacterium]|nr:PEP-CTERM system histidine kinase PrsK [Calditrichota bacterium]